MSEDSRPIASTLKLIALYTLTYHPSFSQIRPQFSEIRPFEVLDTQKFPRRGRIVLFVRNGRKSVQSKALTHLDSMQHQSSRLKRIEPLRKRREGRKKDRGSVKEWPRNGPGNGLTLVSALFKVNVLLEIFKSTLLA